MLDRLSAVVLASEYVKKNKIEHKDEETYEAYICKLLRECLDESLKNRRLPYDRT